MFDIRDEKLVRYKGREETVVIPNEVTCIGSSAFSDNIFVKNVIIPNSVVSIDYGAFAGCRELEKINIPDNLETVECGIFYNCGNLVEISVGENNANYKSIDGDLYSKDGTTLIKYAGGKKDKIFAIPEFVNKILHEQNSD